MKNKIEVGQCYRNNDIVYEVHKVFTKYVHLTHVITKDYYWITKQKLKLWERPFKNWEGDDE